LLDYEAFSKQLNLSQMTGMEHSLALQDKALEGLLLIDGELWSECGKPCVVVRAESNDSRRMASISLATLPQWTETNLRNAYFSIDQIDDAKLYRAALSYELGSNNFVDRVPEYEFDCNSQNIFDGDEWDAERLTEVIGTDIVALSHIKNAKQYEQLTEDQRTASIAVYEDAKRTNHLYGALPSFLDHTVQIVEAFSSLSHRTVAAEIPAPRSTLFKIAANRAVLAAESATITIPVSPWSHAP
jgi:hypothetical protein